MRIERRTQQIRVLKRVDARAAVMGEIQRQNRDQHQQAAQLRKKEKLHRRVYAAFMAPDRDQKIHRDQHELPGKIEKEKIEREKDAGDSRENPQHS